MGLNDNVKWGRPGIRAEGFTKTTANLDIYVNNSTGDDDTGDGSSGSPYLTLDRAWQAVPEVREHRVRLLLASTGTDYDAPPNFMGGRNEGNGSIAIIGVGAPNSFAGPYTVTGVATEGVNAGLKISASAAGWPTDGLYGSFIRMLTGTRTNYTYPGFKNSSTDFWSIYYTNKPSNTDTFDAVLPAVTIVLERLTIDCRNSTEYWGSGWENSDWAFVNVTLDFSTSSAQGGNLTIKGPGYVWMDFVRILVPSGVIEPIMLIGGPFINYYLPKDTGLKATSGSSVVQIGAAENAGIVVQRDGGAVDTLGEIGVYATSARLNTLSGRDLLVTYDCGIRIERIALGRLSPVVSKVTATSVLLHGKSGSVGYTSHTGTEAIFLKVHVLTGTSAFRVNNSRLNLSDCTCDSSLTGYGIEVLKLAHVGWDKAISNCSGTSGAIQFKAPVPEQTPAWPDADGVARTDGLGSFVVRVDG